MKTLFVCLASIALPLSAHDTWIAATTAGEVIQIEMTSGQKFPRLETAIKPDRIARASIRQLGREAPLTAPKLTQNSLRFVAPCAPGAIATIAVELAPKALELKPKQVTEYLKEIGQPTIEHTPRWREVYTKHAKTFVRCSERTRDQGWRRPVGLSLEIVPGTDPTSLINNRDYLTFQLMSDGKPLADFPVTVQSESGARSILKTDASGHAIVALPAPGRYLLAATVLRRSTKPNVEWESDFTTLTFYVQ